jgi:hypothetical protein
VASGHPAGHTKQLVRYCSYRSLIALDQVVLGMFAFEVPRPPAGAVEFAVRRGGLAQTNPLLEDPERSESWPRKGSIRSNCATWSSKRVAPDLRPRAEIRPRCGKTHICLRRAAVR